MNTIDVKYNNDIDSWNTLFKLAREQFLNYEKIEGIENWDEYDFSIDCSSDQMKFKDMLQIRFIEELTESSIALHESEEHFWEEIGDSLNFFLSAMIMLGVDLDSMESPDHFLSTYSLRIVPDPDSFGLSAYTVIESVGYLCNLLKNRPWAQSNYLVSMYDFDERLRKLWCIFWGFMGDLGLIKENVFEIFWKKFKVNEHRMSTNY